MKSVAGVAVAAALAATGFLIPKRVNKSKQHLVSVPRKSIVIFPVEKSVEVHVPAIAAYNYWINFHNLPKFLGGVYKVEQVNENLLRWDALIDGSRCEWEAEITQKAIGERISWCSVDGKGGAGMVTFNSISNATTWVTVQMEYPLERSFLSVGEAVKVNSTRLQNDVKRFKAVVESHIERTGLQLENLH